MSTRLLSSHDINTLTSWAALVAPKARVQIDGIRRQLGSTAGREAASRCLHAANVAAFVHWYPQESSGPHEFEPRDLREWPAAKDPRTASRLLSEYLYQVEDCPTWNTSDAAEVLHVIRHALIAGIGAGRVA